MKARLALIAFGLFLPAAALAQAGSPQGHGHDHDAAASGPMEMRDAHGSNAQEKHMEAIMMMDQDKDGTIARREFITAAEDEFKEMDMNGDGELTKEEQQQMAKEWSKKYKHKEEMKGQSRGMFQGER